MQPAASAGATFQLANVSGKFHGTTAPTTPVGSRVTRASESGAVWGDSSVSLSASCPYQRKVLIAARSSMAYASVIGLPISRLTVSASSSRRSSSSSAIRSRTRPRSAGARRGHGPVSKARRAAATARSTSASRASATRTRVWPSRGEITANDAPSPASSLPSMWCCVGRPSSLARRSSSSWVAFSTRSPSPFRPRHSMTDDSRVRQRPDTAGARAPAVSVRIAVFSRWSLPWAASAWRRRRRGSAPPERWPGAIGPWSGRRR